jgi:DNA-directed RNA polymerase specialized sigma24 family protein
VRAHWQALYEAFERTLRSHHQAVEFRRLSKQDPVLARFSEPEAVVEFFRNSANDPDEKDRVLAALVAMVQSGVGVEIGTALLWLGLWPGLDRVFRRRIRYFGPSGPGELVSAIGAAFTALIHGCDSGRVRRVAATLVRSTERAVLEQLRLGREAAGVSSLRDEEEDREASVRGESQFGLPEGLTPEGEILGLARCLVRLAPQDADLLLRVAVLGKTRREAAAELGIPADTAQKRIERALVRLRQRLLAPWPGDGEGEPSPGPVPTRRKRSR